MSRGSEEVNKLTESTYKNVMEQFNPGLRNLINLGKNYEKAVNGMVLAGRAYYDCIAKIGDTAVASPVSKELGDNASSSRILSSSSRCMNPLASSLPHHSLHPKIENTTHAFRSNKPIGITPNQRFRVFSHLKHKVHKWFPGHVLIEISIAQKKLNDKLEENFKKFHKEIISELEKKTELDVKYMNATLKRYQNEHRSKLDSLEKSQAELKKIRRKSQGGRNAIKYEHRESEYLETVSSRQSDIQRFIAEGCREALLEEKKRFCFLVDKHCNFAQRLFHYHVECSEILTTKLPAWLETCSDATKVPATVMNMIDEIKSTGSVSISGTPLPSPMIERNNLVGNNYDSLQRHSPKVPPAPLGRAYTSPLVDMFNNPPVIPQTSSEKLSNATDDSSLLRSTSVATGLNIMKRQKVKTIFPHTAGNNKTLLSFAQGDLITLFVSEERDGWLYGEHDVTKVKGWFPSSYTTPFEGPSEETVRIPVPSPAPTRSVSSVNLTNRESPLLPPPDYVISGPTKPASEPKLETSKTTVAQGESISLKPNMNGIMKPPFLSGENPFATVKLRPTVTNDRSAPILR